MSDQNGHKRLRIVSFQVQPVLLVDDGENLSPLPVQPLNIPAERWGGVVEEMAAAIGRLRAEVEEPS
jgi:hypothetical protein